MTWTVEEDVEPPPAVKDEASEYALELETRENRRLWASDILWGSGLVFPMYLERSSLRSVIFSTIFPSSEVNMNSITARNTESSVVGAAAETTLDARIAPRSESSAMMTAMESVNSAAVGDCLDGSTSSSFRFLEEGEVVLVLLGMEVLVMTWSLDWG